MSGWGKNQGRSVGDIRERKRPLEFCLFHEADSAGAQLDPWGAVGRACAFLIEYEGRIDSAIGPVIGNTSSQAWIGQVAPFNEWCMSNAVKLDGARALVGLAAQTIIPALWRRYNSVQFTGDTTEAWQGPEGGPLRPQEPPAPWPNSSRANGYRPAMVLNLLRGRYDIQQGEPPSLLLSGFKVLEHLEKVWISHSQFLTATLAMNQLENGMYPPASDPGLQIWLNGGMGGWGHIRYVIRNAADCAAMHTSSVSPMGFDVDPATQVICEEVWRDVIRWEGLIPKTKLKRGTWGRNL